MHMKWLHAIAVFSISFGLTSSSGICAVSLPSLQTQALIAGQAPLGSWALGALRLGGSTEFENAEKSHQRSSLQLKAAAKLSYFKQYPCHGLLLVHNPWHRQCLALGLGWKLWAQGNYSVITELRKKYPWVVQQNFQCGLFKAGGFSIRGSLQILGWFRQWGGSLEVASEGLSLALGWVQTRVQVQVAVELYREAFIRWDEAINTLLDGYSGFEIVPPPESSAETVEEGVEEESRSNPALEGFEDEVSEKSEAPTQPAKKIEVSGVPSLPRPKLRVEKTMALEVTQSLDAVPESSNQLLHSEEAHEAETLQDEKEAEEEKQEPRLSPDFLSHPSLASLETSDSFEEQRVSVTYPWLSASEPLPPLAEPFEFPSSPFSELPPLTFAFSPTLDATCKGSSLGDEKKNWLKSHLPPLHLPACLKGNKPTTYRSTARSSFPGGPHLSPLFSEDSLNPPSPNLGGSSGGEAAGVAKGKKKGFGLMSPRWPERFRGGKPFSNPRPSEAAPKDPFKGEHQDPCRHEGVREKSGALLTRAQRRATFKDPREGFEKPTRKDSIFEIPRQKPSRSHPLMKRIWTPRSKRTEPPEPFKGRKRCPESSLLFI